MFLFAKGEGERGAGASAFVQNQYDTTSLLHGDKPETLRYYHFYTTKQTSRLLRVPRSRKKSIVVNNTMTDCACIPSIKLTR